MDLFSFSRLQRFDTCPRQFAYKYVLGLDDPSGPPAVLGKTIHKAIEHCLNGRSFEDAIVTAYIEEGDSTVDKTSVESMVNTALIYGLRGPTEQHFVLPLAEGIKLQGYIDLKPENVSVPTIVDWKTGFKFYRVLDTWQLPLYAAAVMEETGAKFVKGVLAFLRFNKTPYTLIGRNEVAQAKAWAIRTARDIQLRLELLAVLGTQEAFPAKPSPACQSCNWSYRCLSEEIKGGFIHENLSGFNGYPSKVFKDVGNKPCAGSNG